MSVPRQVPLEERIFDAMHLANKTATRERQAVTLRVPTCFEFSGPRSRGGNALSTRLWDLRAFFDHGCHIGLEVVCGGQPSGDRSPREETYAFATPEEFDAWRGARENRRVVAMSINILVTSK